MVPVPVDGGDSGGSDGSETMKIYLSAMPSPASVMVDRRRLLLALFAAAGLPTAAYADLLSQLTQGDASAGLKAALERGAAAAVDLLGRTDGFWANDRVRIPLPEWLDKAKGALKLMGRGKDVDDLHQGVNRAAEQAVPEAKVLLVGAVHSMTVQDAKAVLTGGDDAGTRYFETKTRQPLGVKFTPIVTKVTQKIGLAQQYNALAAKAGSFGLVKGDVSIEHHVTTKALDGLFLMIGEEEKKIRSDPAATGSALLKKVFGAL
jgi:hypothetical protein